MIHVNVKRARPMRGYAIEVSCDGAPWVEHWFLPPRGDNELDRDLAAKSDARIYAAGIKFGGGEVRLTAFGEEVHVPAMDTIPYRLPQSGGR